VEAINWEASPIDQSLKNTWCRIFFHFYGSARYLTNTPNCYYLTCGERVKATVINNMDQYVIYFLKKDYDAYFFKISWTI
jgi:hypothetical protein